MKLPHHCSTTLFKKIPYGISLKYDERFNNWYWSRTDGRKDGWMDEDWKDVMATQNVFFAL